MFSGENIAQPRNGEEETMGPLDQSGRRIDSLVAEISGSPQTWRIHFGVQERPCGIRWLFRMNIERGGRINMSLAAGDVNYYVWNLGICEIIESKNDGATAP
jgi:hypothetical protein